MPNIQRLSNSKDKILSTIRIKGPSLPVHIAKALETSPLFASAFLSELYSDKEIKMSNMKVGNSPLYYITGQEHLLEKFVNYLNTREKEAFFLLKEKKILNDEKQTPVIRVALRAIKDFAIPIRARINNEPKLFWKYFQLSEEELREKLQEIMGIPKPYQTTRKPEIPEVTEEKQAEKPIPSRTASESKKQNISAKTDDKVIRDDSESEKETISSKTDTQIKIDDNKISKDIKKLSKKRKTKPVDLAFTNNVRDYLRAKDIEIIDSISEKKREYISKVRIDTLLGKQEYLLIAKDKKKITENDINLAIQKSQAEKMPAFLISPGDIDKKAIPHLEDWKNLIKFEKVNL